MRILYYFRDYGTVMFSWQTFHIVNEMKHYNCEIEIFNPLKYDSIEQANEMLLNQVRNQSYDIFLTCHNEELLYIDTLQSIKKLGIPTLLFCPDNLLAPFNHEHIASYFDLVWLTSKETEYLFKKWNCNTVFLPYAANPYYLIPDYSNKEILTAGFIGTPHGSRADRINQLVNSGIPVTLHTQKQQANVKVFSASADNYAKAIKSYLRYPIGRKILWGSLVDKVKRHRLELNNKNLTICSQIPFEEMARVSCSYAFMLSFSDAKSTGVLKNSVPIINLRHFELPMSGALQFTTYTKEISEYFEDNKEIILCHNSEEYIDKAKFYLREDQAETRKLMKNAARIRAVNEHTWKKRFEVVFSILGINKGLN